MNKEMKYDIYSLPSVLMLQHSMDDKMVEDLNDYLDGLQKSKDKKSASEDLVGQIHSGEQLIMDPKDKKVASFRDMAVNLGIKYIQHFVQHTGTNVRPKKLGLDKLWSVHSYEGDYNPIHDHLTLTNMGISFTCWTKVPEQITKHNMKDTGSYDLYNNSGAIDGFINFTYGLNQTGDPEKLRPSQSRYIKPEVGKFLMFPSWMQHCVYPFFGKGERRTVAGNLNCFDLTKEDIDKLRKKQ
jgi:hypothetical protein|tara:strand:+ start:758 stop:1477 length:720 start_codon:yes stop_codon:yes gene_type:complete